MNNAKELIKHFEGLRLESYRCPAGIPTIGWGHTSGVIMGDKINEKLAEQFLDYDYTRAASAVDTLVKVPLTTNQREALISFVFNLGKGKLMGSTLLRKLNSGDYYSAAREFDKWVFAGGVKLNGLIARRKAERELFERK